MYSTKVEPLNRVETAFQLSSVAFQEFLAKLSLRNSAGDKDNVALLRDIAWTLSSDKYLLLFVYVYRQLQAIKL